MEKKEYMKLSHERLQQLIFAECCLFDEAGFSPENLEKIRTSMAYKSALYFDALRRMH